MSFSLLFVGFFERLIIGLLFALGLFAQAVDDVEKGVAGHDVGPGLGAALGIDRSADVGKLAEEIEGVELEKEVAA